MYSVFRIAVVAIVLVLANYMVAAEFQWRFPSDKITLEQWTEFREEVLSKPDIERQEFANQLVLISTEENRVYVFTQPQHAAYPAVVVRAVVGIEKGSSIQRMGHYAGDKNAFDIWWHEFDALDAVVSNAIAVSVTEVRPGKFELVLTHPTRLSYDEALTQIMIAAANSSVCNGIPVIMARYHYEANETIGIDEPLASEMTSFRFVQELECGPGVLTQPGVRLPTLENEEEAQQVKAEVKLKSEAYFQLIAASQVDEAVKLIDLAGMDTNAENWKTDKLAFQAITGEPLEISIYEITVYDNPTDASEPGLYVAADYSNSYRNVPFHCGYLMWFRPPGGEFRVRREETGYITAANLKEIPVDQLPEIKRRLRCDEL